GKTCKCNLTTCFHKAFLSSIHIVWAVACCFVLTTQLSSPPMTKGQHGIRNYLHNDYFYPNKR
ncbi:hypothetical protein, partial [Bacillus pseudomycoides]|uniref:hypothetical protein n=1 Tax=Bacillus pseudomycoides TaxID=64104 RepID=UPI0019551A06